MSVRRENTFRIDYANVPKKPSFEELHDFIGSALGLKYEQVVRLQPSRALGCAFVKVVDLELAQKIVAEHDNMHESEIDGKVYKLRIMLEDGTVEVKLTDLSEDITNEQISEFLTAFGDVLSVTEQMWDSKYRFAGLPTGTRLVRMLVKRNIPSYVTIDGQTTNVVYHGQLQTCRYCSEFVHNGISCVQNKKLLVQKTYANVTKNSDTKSVDPKPAATKKKTTFAKLFGPKPGETSPREPTTATKKAIPADSDVTAPKPTVPPASASNMVNTKVVEQNTNLMAPPTFPNAMLPSSRMTTRQASDGNETDNSSTSNTSKRRGGRPPGKKLRQNYADDSSEEAGNRV